MHSANYANAETCRFSPPGKATPYADVFAGKPDELTYDAKAAHPTRRDEPDLPGEAYSFTEGDAVTVVLRSGEGEAAVTVGGLGARNRDAARAIVAELIRLSAEAQ